MSKFATENIPLIKARENVEQLVINGVRVLDAYRNDLTGTTYISEYESMIRYIEHAANGNSLPENKMRKYGGNNDGVSEYEFKSKHLRVWAIQQPGKKIVILGGFKNSQSADERSFRALKKQFLESLQKK